MMMLRQELHADVSHGPWAFVLSLTPWEERKFSGGETFMLRPEVLSYWNSAAVGSDANNGLELPNLIETIPPEVKARAFHMILVFNADVCLVFFAFSRWASY